jgi:hypothetical protein
MPKGSGELFNGLLVRRVSEILQLQPGNLIHLPDKPAGVFSVFFALF